MEPSNLPVLNALKRLRSYELVDKGLEVLRSNETLTLLPDADKYWDALKEQGWINPDNVGVTWYHPLITTPDAPGGALMSEQLVTPIAQLWEKYPERKPDARITFSTDNDPLD